MNHPPTQRWRVRFSELATGLHGSVSVLLSGQASATVAVSIWGSQQSRCSSHRSNVSASVSGSSLSCAPVAIERLTDREWLVLITEGDVKAELRFRSSAPTYRQDGGQFTEHTEHYEQLGHLSGSIESPHESLELSAVATRDCWLGQRSADASTQEQSFWLATSAESAITYGVSEVGSVGRAFGYGTGSNTIDLAESVDLASSFAYTGGPALMTRANVYLTSGQHVSHLHDVMHIAGIDQVAPAGSNRHWGIAFSGLASTEIAGVPRLAHFDSWFAIPERQQTHIGSVHCLNQTPEALFPDIARCAI